MKNLFNVSLIRLFGIIALTAIIGFGITACGEEDDDPPATTKEVASQYRFTNGEWIKCFDFNIGAGSFDYEENGTVTVTANTITFSADDNLNGVYTEGGGNFNVTSKTGTWTYLYNGSGKIGVALAYSGDDEGAIEIFIGKNTCDFSVASAEGISAINTSGMQNTKNGMGHNY